MNEGTISSTVIAFVIPYKQNLQCRKFQYGLGEYHSYDHITSWMDDIQRNYPNRAKVVNIGTTEEGRPIKGIKVSGGIEVFMRAATA